MLNFFQTFQCQSLSDYELPKIEDSKDLQDALIRTSSILNKNTFLARPFKIQFYGQSIIAGVDVDHVKNKLEANFSDVDFEIMNNAIGGYDATKLIHTAEYDLYPEYADLIIFHVYGGLQNGELNYIFEKMSNTLDSDVIIFDHHLMYSDSEEGQISTNLHQDKESLQIEALAKKYDFGFISVRHYWKEFLKLNPTVTIKDLLRDHIHPNEIGNSLLECIITESIINAVKKKPSSTNEKIFIDLKNKKRYNSDKLSGNRIDFYPSEASIGSEFEVNVGNIPGMDYSELYAVTRPTSFAWQPWPAINRIDLLKSAAIKEEKWTVSYKNFNHELQTFDFELSGSLSGYQGSGSSDADFTSNNKAISIKSIHHAIYPNIKDWKITDIKDFEITFETYPLFNHHVIVKNLNPITLIKSFDMEGKTLDLKVTKGSIKDSKLLIYDPKK